MQTIIDNFNQASDSTVDINWVKQNYKNDKRFITASNDLKYQTFKYKLKKIYNYTEEELQKFVPADSDPYFIKHLKNFADEFNRLELEEAQLQGSDISQVMATYNKYLPEKPVVLNKLFKKHHKFEDLKKRNFT